MRTYPPTTKADIRRLEHIIRRDFQTSPKPQYPRKSIENMAPEQRAQYDALDAELQELITLTLDLLSDVKPADRVFMLHTLDRWATIQRAEQQAAERQADDDFDPWEDIINALP